MPDLWKNPEVREEGQHGEGEGQERTYFRREDGLGGRGGEARLPGVHGIPEMEGEQRQAEEALLEQSLKVMGEWRALTEKNQKAMIASLETAEDYVVEIMNLLTNEDPICAIEKEFEQLRSSMRTQKKYAKMIKGSPKAVVEIFNPHRFAPHCNRSGLWQPPPST